MRNTIFLFIVLIFLLLGCGTPREATIGVGNEGALRIICNPNDAEVFVDTVSMGEANKYDGKPGYEK